MNFAGLDTGENVSRLRASGPKIEISTPARDLKRCKNNVFENVFRFRASGHFRKTQRLWIFKKTGLSVQTVCRQRKHIAKHNRFCGPGPGRTGCVFVLGRAMFSVAAPENLYFWTVSAARAPKPQPHRPE